LDVNKKEMYSFDEFKIYKPGDSCEKRIKSENIPIGSDSPEHNFK
jgi:hypothetical protein